MKTFNNRPIFLANVDADDCTITTISLVDDPAMELPMYCFDKEIVSFSMQDEMQHNIISCIVRTDYPILRLTADGNPYYILFISQAPPLQLAAANVSTSTLGTFFHLIEDQSTG